MITRETIDKVFSAVRVEEVISEYVQLKRTGANLKGFSPFVDERTPSFVVSPSKQIWKDFSSGKGGSAINFIMELEGFSYPEAIRHLAKKYGIEVIENQVQSKDPKAAKRDALYKIHEFAQEFFLQKYLSEEGELIAQSYFKQRGISAAIQTKFGLGYSPEDKHALCKYLKEKGYSNELVSASGLGIYSEISDLGIDRFRGRVIFPIHNFSGRIVGFAGRILNFQIKTAKYLNSPETDIYSKSDVLYGLYHSKQAISKADSCLLVEGYMDVIALHQVGIENVVASSGTALSVQQIRLIKRLTRNVTVVFDADPAGIKASFRSIDLLLEEDMDVHALQLPMGEDPDSFSIKNGADRTIRYFKENQQDFVHFKASVLLSEAGTEVIEKHKAIKEILTSIQKIKSGVKRELFIRSLATEFDLSEQLLFTELQHQDQLNKIRRKSPIDSESLKASPDPPTPIYTPRQKALRLLEEKILYLLLKYPTEPIHIRDEEGNPHTVGLAEEILYQLDEDDCRLTEDFHHQVCEEIREGIKQNNLPPLSKIMANAAPDQAQFLANMLIEPHNNSDWASRNITFQTEQEALSSVVADTLSRYKREVVLQMIEKEKLALQKKDLNEEQRRDIYSAILRLNQLKRQMDQDIERIL